MASYLSGIDVSSAQGKIPDWNVVKATNTVFYAFCKATEGPNYVDPQFASNWAGIKSCGLVRGAYDFARTQSDPTVEADHFVKTVKAANDLSPGDLLVLDIEVSTITGDAFVNWVLAWCERVEQQTNITPIIYTGGPFFNTHATNLSDDLSKRVSRFPLWLAAYVSNPNNYVPTPWKDKGWTFWQRSGDQAAYGDTIFHVQGIHGNVDHNQFNGTVEELQSFALSLYNSPAISPADTSGNVFSSVWNTFSGIFKKN